MRSLMEKTRRWRPHLVHGLEADYLGVGFATFGECKHDHSQVLAAILIAIIRTKPELGARLGVSVAKRHELLIIEKFGEHDTSPFVPSDQLFGCDQ
jgi:hypothetical protein